MSHLSVSEQEYYLRHFSLPGFDEKMQLKLKAARVLVIGSGGLGAPCLLYLAGAGIGHIGIADHDVISASNLPRQVLFSHQNIGESKAILAAKRLSALNPFIDIEVNHERVNAVNAKGLLRQYDIVVDCTDNFETKYLINDICDELQKPLVYASIFQFEGQLAVFHYRGTTGTSLSYRDLFPAPPQAEFRENCSDAGVLGVLPGILGTMQAGEVLKIVTGMGDVLCDRVMTYDALSNRSSLLRLKPRISIQVSELAAQTEALENISFSHLIRMKSSVPSLILLDVREQAERESVSIGGVHIPLRELPERLEELPQALPIVCYCKSGSRSQRAILFLQEQGFSRVFSLKGGVMGLTPHERNQLQEFDTRHEN
ncbi:molybdenum cofactor biosynthesis protein MoeB [Yersinia similis]|uniref:Molybdenum cofactor biosynthesis protein MoeB n=1 Tax=Yersinia similis TaxID=367190 RepID=A0ABM5PVW0_9GAMM|nr:HesA/MoeB/ThiF family protein [Yersinia similis]AHK19008.1 molybdenum cofactor biosynthesis protein MoeB [Yersinia similis]CFQ59789.1 molybdopterin biosynthesis protein [Yersinia similis]